MIPGRVGGACHENAATGGHVPHPRFESIQLDYNTPPYGMGLLFIGPAGVHDICISP